MNPIKTFNKPIMIKVIIIGILALLLLIPVSMVGNIIHDREFNKQQVISEINSKWGNEQIIAGPILTIPYNTFVINSEGVSKKQVRQAHFLPNDLKIDSFIDPQIRSRGIYDSVVYSSKTSFSGTFGKLDLSSLNISASQLDWENAFISVGISDMRGIRDTIELQWAGEKLTFNPGIKTSDVIRKSEFRSNDFNFMNRNMPKVLFRHDSTNTSASGVSVNVPINKNTEEISFKFELNLDGSQSINFIPIGEKTEVSVTSPWQSPKFIGAFLPFERNIDDNGFTGKWNILNLNRNYPQEWIGSAHNIYESSFGVNLLAMADQYQKSTRAVKYSLLIIVLTFLVYFSSELFSRRKIHPIQYLLIGLSLVLFYALLLSISEVLGFDKAYLISSFATITMITLYARSVLKNKKLVIIQAGILVFLYSFIYILLQLENFALLVGSLGLFIILATVMYISRKIDWYEIEQE